MASLKYAIDWIAENDEPNEECVEEMASLISVLLVADLFGKDPNDVARKVIASRRRTGILGPVARA